MIRNKKCYILIVMLIGAFIFTGCSTSSKYSMNEEYWNLDKMKTEKKELHEKVTRIGENALAGDMYSTTVQEGSLKVD